MHLREKAADIRNILANSGIKTENINLSFGFDNFERDTGGFGKAFAGYNLGEQLQDQRFAKQLGTSRTGSAKVIANERVAAENYKGSAEIGWIA